jgi:hypothetical protein
MPSRKSRIISLRLSEKEYETLKACYASHGIRSLSEFARDAMHRMAAESAASAPAMKTRVEALDGKLAILSDQVSRLSQAIERDASARKTQ